MELKHNRNRNYRGKKVAKGDAVEATERQKQRLLESSQAYKGAEEPEVEIVEPSELSMDNSWREIFNSLKNNGYSVQEGMTKQQLLDLRDD